MGTSKSRSTPSGGGWTKVKTDITHSLSSENPVEAAPKLVGQTISAAGGFSLPSGGGGGTGTGGGGSGGGGGGIRGGGGGGGKGGRRRTGLGGLISNVGGFATSVQKDGLDGGLRSLSLEELRGKPAPEVIAKIAEHLSEDVTGVDQEVLANSIRKALFEAAALEDKVGYENLEAGLQDFLNKYGIEGLIEKVIGQFAFEYVWSWDEQHIEAQGDNEESVELLRDAFRHFCESETRALIEAEKKAGRFEQIDWFGEKGTGLGKEIAAKLEQRFKDKAN